MVEAGARWCRRLGLPRSSGQIYGLLYLAPEPLSLDDMVESLGISKASVSIGTRKLAAWGAIRQVWVPGDRRDFFEVVEDLGALLRSVYREFLQPRLAGSRRRMESLMAALEEECAQGLITREELRICAERLKTLSRLQKRLQMAAPLIEKVL